MHLNNKFRQMLMAGVRNHAIQNSVDVTREQVDALGKQMLDEAKAKAQRKSDGQRV